MDIDLHLPDEPLLAAELPHGALFVCHQAGMSELVLMRLAAEGALCAVVLGCRGIAPRDPGYRPPGALLTLPDVAPVTLLQQTAPVGLRALSRSSGPLD